MRSNAELLEDFLDMMRSEKGCSDNTAEAYRRDLEQFFELAGNMKAEQVNRRTLADYLNELGDRYDYAAKSVARKISALREFFKFLFSEKEIRENPAARLRSPKLGKPLPKFLTEPEVKKLAEAAFNHKKRDMWRVGVMIELMYVSGLRVSELVALPLSAVNFDKEMLFVRGKGSKARTVPLIFSVVEKVQQYILEFRREFIRSKHESKWLFPSLRSASGHLTRDAFFKDLKTLAAEAGISPAKVSPHVLRHSFATSLLRHDVDLRSVQKMLGHESITTTEIYTHIISEDLINKVMTKHPLQYFKK
ncbi:MAG: tyrosine recombinase [Alphaproteobacteria bacterium]|nr:tyrosine recombinase [Alphaproteobacteria bacterium]